jgi:cytochrome b6-f complex iron-sulfur subunit
VSTQYLDNYLVDEFVCRCPCHGSQYNKEGKVIRGPAPLSLALAHREEDSNGKVILRTWTETDFRTGEAPWWK